MQIFARDLLISHRLRYLRAKILYGPRENILLRANRRQELLSSRGLCMISRETHLSSRDTENIFARYCILSRGPGSFFARVCQEFRAKSCDSRFTFFDSTSLIFGFLLLTTHSSIFLCFLILWNSIAASCETVGRAC